MTDQTKHILKIIANSLCITILAGYCIFSIFYFKKSDEKVYCRQVEIGIEDSSTYRFTNELEVREYLQKHHLNPVDKQIGIAEANEIEQCLMGMNVCKKTDCYMGYDSTLYLRIWQRCPIFRVLPDKGKSYYIDQERTIMPISNNFTAHLPVLSGAIERDAAKGKWFDFMQYLQNDKHWQYMIAEVHVDSQEQIVLSSKQGIPYIELGKLEDYANKMEKLRAWYQSYPHKNSDTIYTKITIHYDHLLFCTKSSQHE